MEDTRRKLLENFDAEVHDRLKINMTQSKEYLDRYARMLWAVTKHELGKHAKFDDDYLTFMLKTAPDGVECRAGQLLHVTARYRRASLPARASAGATPSIDRRFAQAERGRSCL